MACQVTCSDLQDESSGLSIWHQVVIHRVGISGDIKDVTSAVVLKAPAQLVTAQNQPFVDKA